MPSISKTIGFGIGCKLRLVAAVNGPTTLTLKLVETVLDKVAPILPVKNKVQEPLPPKELFIESLKV
ncbi:Uncharacterised protein [uncultured archaeon]|nr:Uncharacterised protein [uncultured archaeon]